MKETMLLARDRKTGSDVIIAGRDVDYGKQLEAYASFVAETHPKYDAVSLVQLVPLKKPLVLKTPVVKTKTENQTV